nr:uncharacterized protein CTRU02_15898 [Colletotrichum truncatum]XP_036577328.1 uncharacterized protein CTRU02_12797 [Colletotrichum truncatum]XP_036582280.1 uncharacterized protein CTRU02_07846 [Colletotrichum truncatum]KAF6780544.1 hypothetical protein CTRU02_15898 [Colletotrichum truncatum]KAF6784268.1 hypothetical protein CTRU02_12797 [Colletotrichum truncatum]KAF6790940.1 hypothetical protein CTRU02_07846 [Colletotrichum truncatum]
MERNSREGSPASGVTAKSQSTVPIPQRIESMIDPAVWGNWAIDLTNASPQQLGSYMGFLLETYEKRNLTGLELWNEVSPDFADWSEEDFQNVPPPILRFFRDYLIGNGVYVEMDGKKISKNVALALKKEEFHYWSPQELEQGPTAQEEESNQPYSHLLHKNNNSGNYRTDRHIPRSLR